MEEAWYLIGTYLCQTDPPDVFDNCSAQFTTPNFLVEHHLVNHHLCVEVRWALWETQAGKEHAQSLGCAGWAGALTLRPSGLRDEAKRHTDPVRQGSISANKTGFDGMPDRVPEVEDGAPPALMFVLRDNIRLDANACPHEVREDLRLARTDTRGALLTQPEQ